MCSDGGSPFKGIMHSIKWKIKEIEAASSEVKLLVDSPLFDYKINEVARIDKFQRANCPSKREAEANGPGWGRWEECPDGQVATGVRAYTYKDKYITGLNIVCKTVKHIRISEFPDKDMDGLY